MLEIDGSHGEGGGQIIRYGIAFSVLSQQPVHFINIRGKRSNPGLRPQHYTAVECIQTLCHGTSVGLSVGSSTLEFTPGVIRPGSFSFDIGTAGSITLLSEACILSCLTTEKPILFRFRGGTDVAWSPSWDYFVHVFLPLIQKMGVSVDVHLLKRGYYPKGGGEIELTVHPVNRLQSFQSDDAPQYSGITGNIHISGLPEHIADRMKHAVLKAVVSFNTSAQVSIEKVAALSAGVGISLWSESDDSVLGVSRLGERGVKAEVVGEKAVQSLMKSIDASASVDPCAFDQILPYMLLASQPSFCTVVDINLHAQTLLWLFNLFFPHMCTMSVDQKDSVSKVFIKPQ